MLTTPEWYTPETTIWRSSHTADADGAYKAALRQRVGSGAIHLVREVAARYPSRSPIPNSIEDPRRYPPETLKELAGMADQEFGYLRERFDVGVPKVDWHITEHEDRARLVARVVIIEGVHFFDLFESPEYSTYGRRLGAYSSWSGPGHRLFEMSYQQLMVGHPRTGHYFGDNVHMIDPEPVF